MKEVIALSGLNDLRPVLKIRQLAFRFLREQVVGDAHRQLIIVMQLLDDSVVVRIILKSSSRVHDAGNSQAVQFAHEMPRRVDLIVEAELRSFGKSGI